MAQNLPERLALVRGFMGVSQREMSNILRISAGSWRVVEAGTSVPGGNLLSKLVELGFSADWILTGRGAMRAAHHAPRWPLPDQTLMTLNEAQQSPIFPSKAHIIDPALLGKITDTIASVYKECNARLSPRDLGILSGEKYSEIVTTSDDPEERLVMIRFMATQLRKELSKPQPDTLDNDKTSS